MNEQTPMKCSHSDICRIVEDVFATMLDLHIQECTLPDRLPPTSLTATVHFAGVWKGALLFQCSMDQALFLTRRLMPTCQSMQMDEDVRDALGELANMIGGNLKSVLHPGVALSMPSVVEGVDHSVHIRGGNTLAEAWFIGTLGAFRITVVQSVDCHSKK